MDKIVIASNNKKRKLLEKMDLENNLESVKFLNKKEVIERLYFRYDKRAVYYLVKKYNLTVSNAIMYLYNLYYVEDVNYNNEKLDFLVKIKKELDSANLLIKNNLFTNFITNKEIIIMEDMNTKFDKKIIKDLEKYTTVTIKAEVSMNQYSHEILEFNNIESEVEYITNYICKLYLSGTSLNKIKLINVGEDYEKEFKKIKSIYNLPIYFSNQNNLYGLKITSEFLEKLETLPPYLILEELSDKYKSVTDKKIISKITDVLNNYYWCDEDFSEISNLLIYDFKHTYLKDTKLDEMVEVIDLEELNDDEVGIICGFLVDTLPNTLKDENYLSDKLMAILNLDSTNTLNKINKKRVVEKINNHNNLIITYRTFDKKSECYPSSLINELFLSVTTYNPVSDKIYSKRYSKIKLGKNLDSYNKFGTITNDLKELYPLYKIPFLESDHRYKSINKDKIIVSLKNNDGITISYSDLDQYMKCSFAYYLKKLLKISEYKQSFSALIGNYFHRVLELIRNDDFDLDKVKEEYFKDKELTSKQIFLLKKIDTELIKTIEIVKYQESLSNYKEFCVEEKINLINNNYIVPINIKGFIDKIMIGYINNKKLISLIDYKTGSYNNSLNNTIYGLDLQLPMYAYLVRHSAKFKDAIITGFYISPILPSEDANKDNKEIDSVKKDKMKLQGFSTDNNELLEIFDKTYKDSEMIKGMKLNQDGSFYFHAKTINSVKMENLINLVGEKIDEMINGVLNGDFDINPKYMGEENIACKYCEYKDICFREYTDNVYLKKADYKEFLGGNSNAKMD